MHLDAFPEDEHALEMAVRRGTIRRFYASMARLMGIDESAVCPAGIALDEQLESWLSEHDRQLRDTLAGPRPAEHDSGVG